MQEELEQLSQHLKQNCGGRGVNHQVPLKVSKNYIGFDITESYAISMPVVFYV